MYQRQFGLDHNPFTTTTLGDQVYAGIRQDKVVAKLKIALSKPDAMVALVGPVGVGKSTLALKAAETVSDRVLTAVVAPLKLSQDDLLELLIAEFGINSEASSNMARFQDLRCFFAEQAQDGYRSFVMVEDASVLGADNLKLLDALTAADPRGYTGASLVLLGSADVSALLNSVPLARLRQRLRAEQTLDAFTLEETTDYIHYRIAQAGGEGEQVLDGNVGQAVFQCTQGVARVIDNLMDTALAFAFSHQQDRLLPGMVQKVARSIYGLDTGEPVEAAENMDVPGDATIVEVDEPFQGDVEEAHADSNTEAVPILQTEQSLPPATLTTDADAAASFSEEKAPSAGSELAAEAALTEAALTEPALTEPALTEPAPIEPAPAEPALAEPALAEPALAEPGENAPEFVPAPASPAAVMFDAPVQELRAGADAEEMSLTAAEPTANAEVIPAAAELTTAQTVTADEPPTDNQGAIPVEAPGAQNEIPILEDAIDLALMGDDGPAIADALASEPATVEADAASSEMPGEMPATPQPEAEPAPSAAAEAPGSFEDWATNVAQAASLEELDAQIAETLFGTPELDSLGEEIDAQRQAAKPLEERDEESGGIVANNVAGGGLG